ncbi:MAG: xanthine dehydrogenase family protein molybdopterin-binding subunit [Syntrophorhabdus sp.]|jgi:4-hydroxybenzoyl-CoA reductase subunit alpha|nr:molybdopterin-dependent oxidoreductase [Syntrophorhabdus sp.]MDI9557419.1 xanthine dehydrogenase family protein molybdopterin-binding subunit [Pseudomonadota bacterium]OQB73964.1 MAG: 4-hydroxybenzoyl-CoA reductase subunit alpha [Deltaproteobacteria bacterium ADurb.Bin135]HNQ46731.1 xanthine dehydrogenase family protein molybdopterin-binding subunit [Syntrophorhabdus sp.]HNS77374.1 xanthine dehydrogenase family protein molybdopterin-binding subunit [Syntrophorhabdus sp.]
MNKYTVINPHEPFRVLNTHVHNIDGIAKVTGRATYTFDVKLPGMLYGKILRSPYPHAKIVKIDASKALALPGVIAVANGKDDTLGIKQGIWRRYKDLCDEQVLPVDKVRYIGEPVVAVAAITEEIAEKALDLIDVEYEELPATFEPLDAIKKDAPEIHEGFERNINVTRHIEWGDVEEAFEEAEYIREDWFKCGGQAHMCMETRAAVASYTPDGKMTVWTSTQSAYYHQALLAGVLGLREGNVRILAPYVGGGFGGKFELDAAQFCACVLSMKVRKPVKIVFTREEDFIASKRRTPMFYYTRTGVKKDGTFCAREAKVFTNGGAYTGMGATALYLTGFFHSFPYRWKGYRYDGYRVYTNTLPSTSMRGFGAPQAMWCSEQQIEWIAKDLGLDPIEMRRKNSHHEGYVVPGQATIASCGIDLCYDEIKAWIKSKGKLPKNRSIGISACGFMSGGIFNWFDTPYSFSSAVVTVNNDGTVELHVGAQDIGQGSNTTMAIICAEALGVKVEDIKVHSGDTDHCPADLGAWGSRQTLMTGNAVKMAAEDAKKQLLEFAYAQSGLNIVYDLDIKEGWVHAIARPERGEPFADLVKRATRGKDGQRIVGRGYYTPHRKGMISPAYSYMLQGVEVEIDEETGKIKLIDSMTAHDCGQPINHLGLIGQLEGAFSMAAGYGYLEYMPFEDGKMMNPNLVDYKMIRSTGMPPANIAEIDTYEPEGPYGAKEAGEGLTNPTAAAIGNAIFHRFGIQMKECPVRPEMIVNALKEKAEKDKEAKKK